VDDERGLAAGVAADLPVDEVAVAGVEHAVVVRLDRRVEVGHSGSLRAERSSSAARSAVSPAAQLA
jgi:hypothetical protein